MNEKIKSLVSELTGHSVDDMTVIEVKDERGGPEVNRARVLASTRKSLAHIETVRPLMEQLVQMLERDYKTLTTEEHGEEMLVTLQLLLASTTRKD